VRIDRTLIGPVEKSAFSRNDRYFDVRHFLFPQAARDRGQRLG
jgi:hypothetical protein